MCSWCLPLAPLSGAASAPATAKNPPLPSNSKSYIADSDSDSDSDFRSDTALERIHRRFRFTTSLGYLVHHCPRSGVYMSSLSWASFGTSSPDPVTQRVRTRALRSFVFEHQSPYSGCKHDVGDRGEVGIRDVKHLNEERRGGVTKRS
jgi:hypothetical protein